MGSQRLGEKKTKRLANNLHLDIIRAWAHGGYTYDFVTNDHKHGWYNITTNTWGFFSSPRCYNTCKDLFTFKKIKIQKGKITGFWWVFIPGPHNNTIYEHFNSWAEALFFADVITNFLTRREEK